MSEDMSKRMSEDMSEDTPGLSRLLTSRRNNHQSYQELACFFGMLNFWTRETFVSWTKRDFEKFGSNWHIVWHVCHGFFGREGKHSDTRETITNLIWHAFH